MKTQVSGSRYRLDHLSSKVGQDMLCVFLWLHFRIGFFNHTTLINKIGNAQDTLIFFSIHFFHSDRLIRADSFLIWV